MAGVHTPRKRARLVGFLRPAPLGAACSLVPFLLVLSWAVITLGAGTGDLQLLAYGDVVFRSSPLGQLGGPACVHLQLHAVGTEQEAGDAVVCQRGSLPTAPFVLTAVQHSDGQDSAAAAAAAAAPVAVLTAEQQVSIGAGADQPRTLQWRALLPAAASALPLQVDMGEAIEVVSATFPPSAASNGAHAGASMHAHRTCAAPTTPISHSHSHPAPQCKAAPLPDQSEAATSVSGGGATVAGGHLSSPWTLFVWPMLVVALGAANAVQLLIKGSSQQRQIARMAGEGPGDADKVRVQRKAVVDIEHSTRRSPGLLQTSLSKVARRLSLGGASILSLTLSADDDGGGASDLGTGVSSRRRQQRSKATTRSTRRLSMWGRDGEGRLIRFKGDGAGGGSPGDDSKADDGDDEGDETVATSGGMRRPES